MRKAFRIGFIIGFVYILILGFIIKTMQPGEGFGMIFELIIQPAGFLIWGLLEYLTRQIGLGNIIANNPLFSWFFAAIIQGLFFGAVLAGFARLFKRKI